MVFFSSIHYVFWLPSGSTQSFGMWGYNVPWGIVSKRAERGQKTSELSSFHTEGNKDWGKVYFPNSIKCFECDAFIPHTPISLFLGFVFSLFCWSYFPVLGEVLSLLWNFVWSWWSLLPLTGRNQMLPKLSFNSSLPCNVSHLASVRL